MKLKKTAKIRLYPGMSGEEINRVTEEILASLTLREKIRFMSGEQQKYAPLLSSMVTSTTTTRGSPVVPGGLGSRRSNSATAPAAWSAAIPPVSQWPWPGLPAGIRNWRRRSVKPLGGEIRAHDGNYFGGVCINLLRHPAWGRAQETYGEDPHLLGRWAPP